MGNKLEKLAYEYRPHLCIAFALYALTLGRQSPYHGLMAISGMVLLVCALYMFRARTEFRTRTRRS